MNNQPFLGAVMTHPMRSSMERYHRRWWPGWTRVIDDGCGVAENYCRSLEAAHRHVIDQPQAWAMVVCDDVRPVPGLVRALPYILAHAPTPIVSFFSFRYVADVASLDKGERFRMRKTGDLAYLTATAFDGMLDLSDMTDYMRSGEDWTAMGGTRSPRPSHPDGAPGNDVRFTHYVDLCTIAVSTHIPCLVQHLTDLKSLTGNPPTLMGRPRLTETFPEDMNIKEVLERHPYPDKKEPPK